MGPVPDLAERAQACAARLARADDVTLASHIDADGLTSAAIASTALERAEIPHTVVFKKQLDEQAIADIAGRANDVALFTDFGSGQLDVIADHEREGAFDVVVADHHQPADASTEYHLNPLLAGIDGASELSGAGTTYVLARALVEANRDLSALAVVGAVGDMQATDEGLIGANRAIVEEGIAAGVLAERTDLALYGTQTRPLPKLLEYASEVRIPGISNDPQGAVSFLTDLDIEPRDGGDWKRWVDLTDDERQTLASALLQRALSRGVAAEKAQRLVGTTYTLEHEAVGTELRDASEFSTLLNATARYERGDVGLAVCLGDRDEALARARNLLTAHRRNLSAGLDRVKSAGVTQECNIQWFDAGGEIRETIIGIVAGMALGTEGVRTDRPILAFAEKSETETKVSARGTGRLVGQGLDLAAVVGESARELGGDGGGHDIAAGATIPAGTEEAFVAAADRVVGEQMG